MPAQHRLAARLSPEVTEHQVGANASAAHFRQFATVEAGQHDGAAGVACGGGDQAVEHARVLDLVAPTKRLDDALDMAATLANVLDEVEIFVAADLLDANEHGWCPGLKSDTIPNPARSTSKASLPAKRIPCFAPQFRRDTRNPRYSAGHPTKPRSKCGSWAMVSTPNASRTSKTRLTTKRHTPIYSAANTTFYTCQARGQRFIRRISILKTKNGLRSICGCALKPGLSPLT
jgi:hypothetical protein